jgi:hypothetical protein
MSGLFLDKVDDSTFNYMHSWADKIQWDGVGTSFVQDTEHAASQGLTEQNHPGHIMDCSTAFFILLVVHPEIDWANL